MRIDSRLGIAPFTRNLLIVILLIDLTFVAMFIVTREFSFFSPVWSALFSLGREAAFPTVYASASAMAAGLLAFATAVISDSMKLWQRFVFGALGVLFVVLAIDEAYMYHESFRLYQWGIFYSALGLAMSGMLVTVWWFGPRNNPAFVLLLVGGLAIAGAGGVGLENVEAVLCRVSGGLNAPPLCQVIPIFEEYLEMIGLSLALGGIVQYGIFGSERTRWRYMKLVFIVGGVLWLAFVASEIWLFPALETRFLATPTQVEYLEGDLTLVGYRISQDTVEPGGRVDIRLYWLADKTLTENYHLSVHIVTRPDVESVAQHDGIMSRGGESKVQGTAYWIPGVITRDNSIRLRLTQESAVPQSYWILVSVWQLKENSRGQAVQNTMRAIPVHQSDLRMLTPDTVVLTSMVAVPENIVVPEHARVDRFDFADGITLSGYTLPTSIIRGRAIQYEFWWQAHNELGGDFIQFFHLFHSNGRDVFIYDQPPFAERFPTSEWLVGRVLKDDVSIVFPEDLPPGEYEVHTGLYVYETGERLAVSDANGMPVTDNSIVLGSLLVEE